MWRTTIFYLHLAGISLRLLQLPSLRWWQDTWKIMMSSGLEWALTRQCWDAWSIRPDIPPPSTVSTPVAPHPGPPDHRTRFALCDIVNVLLQVGRWTTGMPSRHHGPSWLHDLLIFLSLFPFLEPTFLCPFLTFLHSNPLSFKQFTPNYLFPKVSSFSSCISSFRIFDTLA